MKNLLYSLTILLLALILVSWGSKGHRKINGNMAACFPPEMVFMIPAWTNFVTNHASDADYRKDQDPDESARHYIDIDNYSEFVATGKIPMTWDSVTTIHGISFVLGHGILPWATIRTVDSLKLYFQRGDWQKSAQFAADLGHYVGDGHMPLHITKNYNGQYTGQYGVHSRYETSMVGKFEAQIIYEPDTAFYIDDITSYVFQYIYNNNRYVDSVLQADIYATVLAGNTSSTEYYNALWERTDTFTIGLMKHGSAALANLVYTAWSDAGKPMLFPYGIDASGDGRGIGFQVYPVPVVGNPCFRIDGLPGSSGITIEIYDMAGNLKEVVNGSPASDGSALNTLCPDLHGLAAGSYMAVMKSDHSRASRKFIVVR